MHGTMNLPNRTRVPRWLCGALAIGAACLASACSGGSGVSDKTPDDDFEVGDPAENHTSDQISVVEAGMTARVEGDSLLVTLPIDTIRGVGESAVAHVAMTSIEGSRRAAPIVAGQSPFVLAKDRTTVEVAIDLAALPADQRDYARHVFSYEVRIGGASTASVWGSRSMATLLPLFELGLWAPHTMSADQASSARVWVRRIGSTEQGGVAVTVGDQTASTDPLGQALVPVALPDGAAGTAIITATAAPDGIPLSMQATVQVAPEHAPNVYLSTDKPLYRPGQTMHIRAMALSGRDRTPLANRDVTFEVRDGNGTKVFKKVTPSNEFGIASLTAPLASSVNVGTYEIRATVADTTWALAVEVSEEKLPKFSVAVDMAEPWFEPSQAIEGAVRARTFFGKPIVAGAVTITSSNGSGVSWQGTTNGEGVAAFELPAAGIIGSVPLLVEVVDPSGFTVERAFSAKIASASLQITVVTEPGNAPAEFERQMFLMVTGPVGEPVDATCDVTVGGTKKPLAVAAGGPVVFTMSEKSEGSVACTTAEGWSATRSFSTAYFGGAQDGAVFVRPTKSIFAPGESVEVQAWGFGIEGEMYLDLAFERTIVQSLSAPASSSGATLSFAPLAGRDGTAVITAYGLNAQGDFVSSVRPVFVRADTAQVTVESGAESYLPGSQAALTIRVEDAAGKGQPAALGVAIADEAVFALAGATNVNQVASHYVWSGAPGGLSAVGLGALDGTAQLRGAAILADAPAALSGSWVQIAESSFAAAAGAASKAVCDSVAMELRSKVKAAVDAGELSTSAIEVVVERTKGADPWGNTYRIDAVVSESEWTLDVQFQVISAGIDEQFGTADDGEGIQWTHFAKSKFEQGGPGGGFSASQDSASGFDDNGADTTSSPDEPAPGPGAPAKRDDFPETLYVNPSVLTDSDGVAELQIPLADNITSWRVQAIANTTGGLVGGANGSIVVYQDFFVDVDLPRRLTVDDQLDLPVGVFNYTDTPLTAKVVVEAATWFEFLGDAEIEVLVPPQSSASAPVAVKVTHAGEHAVDVQASAGGFADAIARAVTVIPNGMRMEAAASGAMEADVEVGLDIPASALEGGNRLVVQLMGGGGAQLLDGMDALLSSPNGCFEPMMNATWVNALVLEYLTWTGGLEPDMEATARGQLDSGVQQCVTFECDPGGFTWFGRPDPPHPVLTAFAFIMFEDIGELRDVDEALVERARAWITTQQTPDGGWQTEEGTKNQLVPWDDLRTTCIVTWGLGSADGDPAVLAKALARIQAELTTDVDTYTLAMCANALVTVAPNDTATHAALADLADRAESGAASGHDWTVWGSEAPGITLAEGDVVLTETTALAIQALLGATNPLFELADGGLKYLAASKLPDGNFRSTQGTIQSLRAFVASAKLSSSGVDATVEVRVGGETVQTVAIDGDNRDVVQLVDLAPYVSGQGASPEAITLTYTGEGTLFYNVKSRHYVAWPEGGRGGPAMSVDLQYEPTTLAVGEVTEATVRVTALAADLAHGDMPMVEFEVPPGFDPDFGPLDDLVNTQMEVARYEVKGERVQVYLHHLHVEGDDAEFVMTVPLKARMAMQVTARPAKAWPYYLPEDLSESEPVELLVTE